MAVPSGSVDQNLKRDSANIYIYAHISFFRGVVSTQLNDG